MEGFPEEIQALLQAMRTTIREAAPDAIETISYGMPALKLKGRILVYFAAHKNHIGFYPTGSGIAAFKQALTDWKGSKGTVQFPIDQPLPTDLISDIVKFRVSENLIKAEMKNKR